ncbi:MAG: acetyl-CoA carboxylase biotin carboxyl carrier protein [Pyrinomonadaceae bacterium]|nr:acetyl-CoA carboxylase biotin carboxyl carrier protein [Pyrinomonadaceae bacterium]
MERRSRKQKRNQEPKASLNVQEIREIAELIEEKGFTDFEFENENIRIRLRKELAPQIIQAPQTQSQPQINSFASPVQNSQQTTQTESVNTVQSTTGTQSDVAKDENLLQIVSPIVGTFYRSPSPEAEPFVKIGSNVSQETVVCIVEAMKLMNEIPAEISGEIVKIYVENAQPVEYGQPLFAVKK